MVMMMGGLVGLGWEKVEEGEREGVAGSEGAGREARSGRIAGSSFEGAFRLGLKAWRVRNPRTGCGSIEIVEDTT